MIRILLLADSHLGFDLPVRPRVERRRRGHDFLANYAQALAPALNGEVDIVMHAGDVFDRSMVHDSVAWQAYTPLRQIAERGIPVLVVPGNHERSRLPHQRFLQHSNVHVFDRPRTVVVEVRGTRVAFAGFPYERRDVRTSLPQLVHATGWETHTADLHLLCVHHCFEGATVGPSDYTFTTASDVIRHADVPTGFSAVLTGHIHRHQVLTRDLRGAPLRVPVLYPGSIERTALAELGEAKGYLRLRASPGRPLEWEFCELPARPMIRAELSAVAHPDDALDATIRKLVADAPLDAVISIRISGTLDPAHRRAMSAAHLRTFVPRTMNVEVSTERELHASRRSSTEAQTDDPQLDLLQNMTGDVAPEGDEPEDSLFGSDDTYAPR